jgi:hypothetical protein
MGDDPMSQWQRRRDAPRAAAKSPEMDYHGGLPWTPPGRRRRTKGSMAVVVMLLLGVAGILVYVLAFGGGH